MMVNNDDSDFQILTDIQSLNDPKGAEYRRKQHDRQRKWEKRQRKMDNAIGDIYKVILWIVGAVATAVIGYLVKVWLSKYVT